MIGFLYFLPLTVEIRSPRCDSLGFRVPGMDVGRKALAVQKLFFLFFPFQIETRTGPAFCARVMFFSAQRLFFCLKGNGLK